MANTEQFCTFYVDGLFMGIEVMKVQEIIRYQDMTTVPLSSPVISGLINLRGQIVPALDLRRRLQLNERPADKKPMNVVIRTNEGVMSLLADEIGDVLEIEDGKFEQPPDTINAVARDLILGVYKLEGQLLLVLDTAKAINFNFADSEGQSAAPAAA